MVSKSSGKVSGSGRVCIPLEELAPQEIKEKREEMGLSQFAFSAKYGIPINTLRAWEQGLRAPRATGRKLLHKILAT